MGIAYLRAAFCSGLLLAGKIYQCVVKESRALSHLLHPLFRASFICTVRFIICCCLTGLALSVVSGVSYAEGTVNPTFSTAAPPLIKYSGAYSNFDTPEAACADIVVHQWDYTSSTTLVYDHVEPYNVNMLKCFAASSTNPELGAGWYANVGIMRSCDGLGWVNYAITCTKNICPANSIGTPAINPATCTCNGGYEPAPTRTSCVLVATCPISDLPPITDPVVQSYEDNPNLSDTAHLDPQMRDVALPCLLGVTAAGSPSVGSAYRPPAYNQHLIDVWKKWVNELMDDENPACAARKARIQRHFQRHELLVTQAPVPNSRHTRGLAVDVTINLPLANIDALAGGCGLRRPRPVGDRVHFQFP